MDLVPDVELRTALSNRLSEWKLTGKQLQRTFQFPSFRFAREFVDKVADLAEEINHHPDISLSYDRVTISLTSHDAGGITYRDMTLAGKIQEVAPELTHPSKLKSA
jgi:4a-hydroxytetrahydrobiopterin dehydratase